MACYPCAYEFSCFIEEDDLVRRNLVCQVEFLCLCCRVEFLDERRTIKCMRRFPCTFFNAEFAPLEEPEKVWWVVWVWFYDLQCCPQCSRRHPRCIGVRCSLLRESDVA